MGQYGSVSLLYYIAVATAPVQGGFFLLLDGTDFLLLDITNFLLFGM